MEQLANNYKLNEDSTKSLDSLIANNHPIWGQLVIGSSIFNITVNSANISKFLI